MKAIRSSKVLCDAGTLTVDRRVLKQQQNNNRFSRKVKWGQQPNNNRVSRKVKWGQGVARTVFGVAGYERLGTVLFCVVSCRPIGSDKLSGRYPCWVSDNETTSRSSSGYGRFVCLFAVHFIYLSLKPRVMY